MNKRFEALDAFRGLAAVSVVIFHMHIVDSFTELDFFRGSSILVDFFFVLSGFVLAHAYGAKKEFNLLEAMKSRFIRLYPLHFFMLVVFITLELGKLAAVKLGGHEFNSAPFTDRTDINEIIPNLLLIQSWIPLANHMSFNYPSWSISIELYLYLLFFFSILFFNKLRGAAWCLAAMYSLYLLSLESTNQSIPALRGLSGFFCGTLTYSLYKNISHVQFKKHQGTILELIVVICMFLIVESKSIPQSALPPIFSIAILVFAFESGYFSTIAKLSPLQKLGQLSYSIYMTHAAILFILTSAMLLIKKYTTENLTPIINEVRHLTLGNEFANNILALIVVGVIVYISTLTHKHIELYWQQKKHNTKSHKTINIK